MNIIKFVLSTVKFRVESLEHEIDIIEKQLETFRKAPGTTENDFMQLSLQRNIKATLHDLLITYILTMEKIAPPVAPLMQAISCHIFTLQQNEIAILLQELYGQQSALTTLVGKDYMRFTNDDDITADVHLKMISLVFPWEFTFELLKDAVFIKTLITTVWKYNPKYHKKAVTVIFNSIAKFPALPYFEKRIHFFTAKTPMYFALAELLVTLFSHNLMLNDGIDPLLNFSIAEKCALLSQNCMQKCELNPKFVTILQTASQEKQKNHNPDEKEDIFIRPYITKERFKELELELKSAESLNDPKSKQKQIDKSFKQKQIDTKLKEMSGSQYSSESNDNPFLSEIKQNKSNDSINEKHFQNASSCVIATENIELPELIHVILELRKIPLQLSPTSMLFCLSNALQFLKAALTSGGQIIGADESFQFFAYCLSISKLQCLPAIISFIDKFVDEALQETQFNYFIEQLRAGYQFIDNRLLPVQPFLLFPFAEPPLHLRRILNRVKKNNAHLSSNVNQLVSPEQISAENHQNEASRNEEINTTKSGKSSIMYDDKVDNADPILLEGFSIYSFPTWTNEYSTLFPAMIKYTGEDTSAICYQYSVSSITAHGFFQEKFEDIPTLYGTFFQLTEELIKSAFMIRVESNDYEKCLNDVEAFSAMMLMSDTKITNPRLSMMDSIYNRVKKEWNFPTETSALTIKTAVAEVQRALVILGILPSSFFIDGVLNKETVTAMRTFLKPKKNKLIITPRVFNYIISSAD